MSKKWSIFFLGFATLLVTVFIVTLWWKRPSEGDRGATAPARVSAKTPYADAECPYTFMSWNIANFGRSRSDAEIAFMAAVLQRADIVAVQEVTAGKNFGVQAVAKLANALSRTGTDWDYIVSNPTQPKSPGVERYAFLFKKGTVAINRDDAHLVAELEAAIDREPYALAFHPKKAGHEPLAIFTIHTVPTEKNPMHEVRALVSAGEITASQRTIVAGDFNLGKEKTDPLFHTIGFEGHIAELTSLKRTVVGEKYLLHQYDNIYTKGVRICKTGVVDFVGQHFSPVTDESLGQALKISDHLPVFATFR